MNDEREKLIKLVQAANDATNKAIDEDRVEEREDTWKFLADYLIANGVRLEENQATSDKSKRDVVNTNADRIRDMNNNDLAKHLVEIGWDCHLCSEHERLDNEPLLRCEKCDEQCAKHCLEWLQKPAE